MPEFIETELKGLAPPNETSSRTPNLTLSTADQYYQPMHANEVAKGASLTRLFRQAMTKNDQDVTTNGLETMQRCLKLPPHIFPSVFVKQETIP